MSQRTVERVIGTLATNEEIRFRFRRAPRETIEAVVGGSEALSAVEMEALVALDPALLERFADALDSRLQRVRLPGDGTDRRKQ